MIYWIDFLLFFDIIVFVWKKNDKRTVKLSFSI